MLAGNMGRQVVTMVNNRQKEAHIRLDPAELGSLRIRINADDDALSIQFQASNLHVRKVKASQTNCVPCSARMT